MIFNKLFKCLQNFALLASNSQHKTNCDPPIEKHMAYDANYHRQLF